MSKGFKATRKVWLIDLEGSVQENKFDWYAETWTYQT